MPHITASGRSSDAWRQFEKKVADLFRQAGFRRAKRIELGTHSVRSKVRPDVDVPEIRDLAIDTKYQNGGWHHHSVFLEEVDKYVGVKRLGEEKKYRWAIMPTRAGGDQNILVTMRIEHLLDILQKLFLRNQDGGWGCPRCSGRLTCNGLVDGVPLYKFTCQGCELVILSQEEEGKLQEPPKPKVKEIRGDIIKDRSSSGFTPLPGQRTLRDVVKAPAKAPHKKGSIKRGSQKR